MERRGAKWAYNRCLGRDEHGPLAFMGMLAIAADQFGLGIVTPLLPFVVPPIWVGYILTGQYVAVVVGQSLLGALSDRLGRRRVIAGVMAMDALLFGLTAASTDPGPLLAIRIACGLFAPISLSISWVADVSSTKPRDVYKRNFANVGLMFNVGALLGGAAGGLLGPANWLAANLLSAAPCAAAALLALGSTNPISPLAAGASRAVRGVGATLRAFPYRVVCAQYFMAGAVLGSFYSLAPVMLAGQHGANAGEIAALMLSAAAWNIANNAFVIRPLLSRLGALRFIVAASVASGVSNAALAAAESSLVATYLLYPIIYVSTALQLTVLNMMSSSYAVRYGENALGTINGISRAIFSIGFGIAPIVSIATYQLAPWLPYALAAAGWVVAGALTAMVVRSGDPDPVPAVPREAAASAPAAEAARAGGERELAGAAAVGDAAVAAI